MIDIVHVFGIVKRDDCKSNAPGILEDNLVDGFRRNLADIPFDMQTQWPWDITKRDAAEMAVLVVKNRCRASKFKMFIL